MIHDGTDHTEGIRPLQGVSHPVLSGEFIMLPVSVPVGYCGINLRHDGQDSRMVQCYGCFRCVFVYCLSVGCNIGRVSILMVVVWTRLVHCDDW